MLLYDKDMSKTPISKVEVKKEIETKFSDFCAICGHRYEVGSRMAVLTEAPYALGKIAHPNCVEKHNAKVDAKAARITAYDAKVAAEKLEWAKLTELAKSLKAKG
jgi:hypothetical protein